MGTRPASWCCRCNCNPSTCLSSVIAAFKDVTAAQQDQNRLRNEAEAYANRVVPEANGKAAAIVQEAEGYKSKPSPRRPARFPDSAKTMLSIRKPPR